MLENLYYPDRERFKNSRIPDIQSYHKLVERFKEDYEGDLGEIFGQVRKLGFGFGRSFWNGGFKMEVLNRHPFFNKWGLGWVGKRLKW